MRIFLVIVKKPITKKGTETTGKIKDISQSNNLLNKMAIPVAPPSKNPLGNKKALSPILAKK